MVGIYEVSRWGRSNNGRRSTQEGSHAKKLNIHVISDGITRLPILEGEISHIELPRANAALGMTIVGGIDTPLRCVVVQEVFPDGLVAQDGRLQPGDQIIEVDGVDMTGATHQQVCDSVKKSMPILRLAVYRERIEAYRASPMSVTSSSSVSSETMSNFDYQNSSVMNQSNKEFLRQKGYKSGKKEVMVTIHLQGSSVANLGIRLGGRKTEPGVYIIEVLPGSLAQRDSQLQVLDRVMSINGTDVRETTIENASDILRQARDSIDLSVLRSRDIPYLKRKNSLSQDSLFGFEENYPSLTLSGGSSSASECSAPDEDAFQPTFHLPNCSRSNHSSLSRVDSKLSQDRLDNKLTKQLDPEISSPDIYRSVHGRQWHESPRHIHQWETSLAIYEPTIIHPSIKHGVVGGMSQVFGRRKEEVPLLRHKQVLLAKVKNEGLGMRIGGGLNSNEGDTPIYVANINNQGPAGKSRQIMKGDVVLSVNNNSLLSLTHSQAVALLKATAEFTSVKLTLLEGPETCTGHANFVPSWLYWQRLPRNLHISKSVILQRPLGASLGFSIVGGSDPEHGPEPIHVLFVVSTSPAAVDGRLRCGDRLLAVDGRCLEAVSHATAVSLLKHAGQRVALEVVSWMGTEL